MNHSSPITVLFTGYAPVHFLCFLPLYRQLAGRPDYRAFVSGGLKSDQGEETTYDTRAMYRFFDLPGETVLSVEEIKTRDFDILVTANTRAIEPRHAGTRIQIFHGISFRNKAVRPENMHNDYFFLVGPYMQRRFAEAGLLGDDDPRALKMGFPKTDRLINGELDRRELMARYGFEGRRPIVLYAPTGQRHNSLETMGERAIMRLKESSRYDILVKPHDHPKDKSVDWFSRLSSFEDRHLRLVRDPDVIPQLFLADLLITDASSVSSEYALLDRPMVFLDVPELIERSLKKDAMVDLTTWGRNCGEIIRRPEEVVAGVAQSLAMPDKFGQVRKEMVSDLFYNPGSSTEAVMTWWRRRFARGVKVNAIVANDRELV